jgi:hypothetical protein
MAAGRRKSRSNTAALTATYWKVTVTAASPNTKGARQPISTVVLSFVKIAAALASANASPAILLAEIGGWDERGHWLQLHARFAADHNRDAGGLRRMLQPIGGVAEQSPSLNESTAGRPSSSFKTTLAAKYSVGELSRLVPASNSSRRFYGWLGDHTVTAVAPRVARGFTDTVRPR